MSYQFRILGTLAMVFKAVAVVQLLVGIGTFVFLARTDNALAGVLAVTGAMVSALVTFSIGSLIDLARACEAHLRTIAHDSSGWVTTTA